MIRVAVFRDGKGPVMDTWDVHSIDDIEETMNGIRKFLKAALK